MKALFALALAISLVFALVFAPTSLGAPAPRPKAKTLQPGVYLVRFSSLNVAYRYHLLPCGSVFSEVPDNPAHEWRGTWRLAGRVATFSESKPEHCGGEPQFHWSVTLDDDLIGRGDKYPEACFVLVDRGKGDCRLGR